MSCCVGSMRLEDIKDGWIEQMLRYGTAEDGDRLWRRMRQSGFLDSPQAEGGRVDFAPQICHETPEFIPKRSNGSLIRTVMVPEKVYEQGDTAMRHARLHSYRVGKTECYLILEENASEFAMTQGGITNISKQKLCYIGLQSLYRMGSGRGKVGVYVG